MALFTIRRYQGDIISSEDTSNDQHLILEKLHQKVKLKVTNNKKGKISLEQSNDEGSFVITKPIKEHRSKKRTSFLTEDQDAEINAKKNNVTESSKVKKKTLKRRKSEMANETLKSDKIVKEKKSITSRRKDACKSGKDKVRKKGVERTADKCIDMRVDSNTSSVEDEQIKDTDEEKEGEEKDSDTDDVEVESTGEQHTEFTVLGEVESKKKKKVQRVLPEWLAQPTVVEHDIKRNKTAIGDIEQLDARMRAKLLDNGVTHFFPVQSRVIPLLLASLRFGNHVGNVGYRPRDLCVSAPTGSGKTLAFVIPIIQALLERVVPQVRALAVLPTKELADQVYAVFSTYCKGTSLKVTLLGGQKTFGKEQELLVRKRHDGNLSNVVDIVVSTPGRLVDHINLTTGFTLQHLRFLVIDEADRMMDNISKNWIKEVEKSAFPDPPCRPVPSRVTASSVSTMKFPPLQKLLFSATLSQNPEKLTQLNLFQPELLTSVITRTVGGGHQEMEGDNKGEFVGKYTTPVELTEYMINCTAGEKPLMILHLILNLYFKNVLCFTNTVEETHRLYLLVNAVGTINVQEFSSQLSKSKRAEVLRKFKAGKIQLLISSDAMARGMDVDNVRCVISYDVPPFIKTYIHRVGRTARAGRTGLAFSLVQKSEMTRFTSMLSNVGKNDIKNHRVKPQHLVCLEGCYEQALNQLKYQLKEEKLAHYGQ